MESQVCVHCLNKKAINSTTNRLVTESCGHVKCMDCLLHETAGCVACAAESSPKEPEDTPEPSEGPPSDGDNADPEPIRTEFPLQYFLLGREEDEKESQAEYCYDKTEKKKKLETSHIRVETDGNRRCYFCTACKRKFHARSQVSYHAYCNGQQKPYQCPECNKSFASHSHFKYHMRVHRNERTYACELCGEGFFQMSKLQRHKLKHTKEKKYPCPECSKAFNNLTALRKHALTHSDERPYGCETCGRRFRDSSNYRKHVAKHNGTGCGRTCSCGACGRRRARAHLCPRCPQAFHARKDMRRHAAVHDDSKPFRCRVCSRRFRRKDNLERHIRNTHPAEPPADAVLVEPADRGKHADEKTKLQSLNPLPPLPQELIQKHLHEDKANQRPPPVDESKFTKLAVKLELQVKKLPEDKHPEEPPEPVELKAQQAKEQRSIAEILAANNARQSVITSVRRAPPEPSEYVHKIRKQRSIAEILAANNARQSVITSVRRAPPEPSEYVHKIRKANRRLPALLPPIDESKFAKLANLDLQNNLDVGAPPEKFRELYKKILYERSEKDALEEQHWKKKKLNINWSVSLLTSNCSNAGYSTNNSCNRVRA
ncbi:zinc finger and BTB domain-containing protein 24-like [Cydia fagiglandana]|uniref:zinc finger and BTB domain-containing protein 24-like n=1 Tax=Cydia fagiglandana TaxID=1458189 RepID=UPI002FEDE7A7